MSLKENMEFLRALARKHPAITYYLITFIISWGGVIWAIGGPAQITPQATGYPFIPLYLITVAGPSMTCLFLTGFYGGRKGYRELLSRLFKWRVGIKWYLAALLAAPLSVFPSLFILSLISPVFRPGIFSTGDNPLASMFGLASGDKITLILFVLMLGLFNGFVEELGWTGFVTPKLRLKHSVIATGINVGIMWGLWHFISNYLGSATAAGMLPLPLYLLGMLFSFLPPFRILMVWVYDHTESLLIGMLMHASLNLFWMLAMPLVLTGQQRVVWYLVWAVILWAFALAAVITNKKIADDKVN